MQAYSRLHALILKNKTKLPRHVYSPNSEASVSNDGKIPGFCKFLFLSSVIKFDNEMSEAKTKITIANS